MPGVLLYSDALGIVPELVTLALRFGNKIGVVVTGDGDLSQVTSKLSVGGVTDIYEVSDASLKSRLTDPLVDSIQEACKRMSPDLVLIGSTKLGKEIAPRIAVRMKFGCVSDAINVESTAKGFKVDRVVWGGNAIATVETNGPAVLTIPAKLYGQAPGSSSPSIVRLGLEPRAAKLKLLEVKKKEKSQTSIRDAETVVSAGRGFKKKEDLRIVEDLAEVLNGAVGASRPLASDLGWVSEERQVGLSGTTVKPKLYVAVGISGQIQHLTGMRDSKIVVAINTDKNAPIFQECDYGVVGDLYSVVPELTKMLRAHHSG